MPRRLFDVDAEGLKQLIARRGKALLLFELYQNARDQNVTKINITFCHEQGRTYLLRVEDDDPNGFADLRQAWTLFAPSEKKDDPSKGGMFNIGEKLVIACCSEATIITTRGGVRFDTTRHRLHQKREAGSGFEGRLVLTKGEWQEAYAAFGTILPTQGKKGHCSTITGEHAIQPSHSGASESSEAGLRLGRRGACPRRSAG